MPFPMLLLALAIGLVEVQLPPIVGVEIELTNLECSQHAFVVVATNQTNSSSSRSSRTGGSTKLAPSFTCENAMSEPSQLKEASALGALIYSWGRWDQSSTTTPGCDLAAAKSSGGGTPLRSHIYLRTDMTYAVCGVSFYNDGFGTSGKAVLTERSSGRVLTSFDAVSNTGSAAARPTTQCAVATGSGQACSFGLGTVAIEAANCSSTQHDVASGISFCASMNRSECSLVPQTCGPCLECHIDDTAAEQASGGEQGSGSSSMSGITWSAFGNTVCTPSYVAEALPPPTLLTEGERNSFGPAGAGPTSLRMQWVKPDCDPVQRFAIRLKEGDGSWVTVYEGHPGGGFSQSDTLHLMATPGPAPPPSPAPPPGATGVTFATIIGAVMRAPQSTVHHIADNCANGNLFDMCEHQQGTDPWLSLRVDASTAIDQVVVYNRRHSYYWSRINPFHVYVGDSYGKALQRVSNADHAGGIPILKLTLLCVHVPFVRRFGPPLRRRTFSNVERSIWPI
jgi:hypothetical protein